MATRRTALLIATDTYADETLRQLRAPREDTAALAELLSAPDIGGFEVCRLVNERSGTIQRHIEKLFSQADLEDLILLFFSGHGIKGVNGHLYLASTDTEHDMLASTTVPAQFVSDLIDGSRARQIVVWLDCCYSGAFPAGKQPKASGSVDVVAQLADHTGRGVAVMTASTHIQYAFEHGDVTPVGRKAAPSVFTEAIVEGLRTGEADLNADGEIDAAELYSYVRDRVKRRTPNQTPTRNDRVTDELYIAQSNRGIWVHPTLASHVASTLRTGQPRYQELAIKDLAAMAAGADAVIAAAATETLNKMKAGPLADLVLSTLNNSVTVDDPVDGPAWNGTGELAAFPAFGANEPPWISSPPDLHPPAPEMDSLTADSPARPTPGRRRRPTHGWRKALLVATAGLVNVGEGSSARQQDLVRTVNTLVQGSYRIAVIGQRGGVGKTTVTTLVGSCLAAHRGDRVLAVDVDPDCGTLSQRVPQETTATIRHLLRDLDRVSRHSDVRAYTSQAPSHLEVLAGDHPPMVDDVPTVSVALGNADYRRVMGTLSHFYNIVLADCGTGLADSIMRGVLDLADSLIVVSSAALDGARSASATLDWLEVHGYQDLLTRSVVVINSVWPKSGVDLDKLERHFAARCRAVCRLPFDSHLAQGAEIDRTQLDWRTREAVLELTAAVAEHFPSNLMKERLPNLMAEPEQEYAPPTPAATVLPVPEPSPATASAVAQGWRWQDALRDLDEKLGGGKITADDYRVQRDDILQRATGS